MYYILLDDISSMTKNIVVTKRPSIPAPEPDYTDIAVEGVSGNYIEFNETYRDITVSIEFNYITNPNNWHQIWRNVKNWLLTGGMHELKFSDDLGFYRVVKKITLDTHEREFIETAAFTANFTFSPYEYAVEGKQLYTAEQCAINPYSAFSCPNYYITGEGMCTLTVNGNTMTANVGQNLTINTLLQLAYRTDGTAQNTDVTGNYEDLYLLPGQNQISITDGFDLLIQPNWRCL